jgi:signal transduction histidine kinase
MKNINYLLDSYKSILFIFVFSVVVIFCILTFLKSFVMQWFLISLIFCFIFLIFIYILKKHNDKIISDIAEIKHYLNHMTKKEYDAVLQVENFKESLEIAILLKNIAKRLKQKEKKSSKK